MDSGSSCSSADAASSSFGREGPAWLPHFLTGDYFSQCGRHVSPKNDRNHFCIDCVFDGPMCAAGLHTEHAQHRSLQVRRASHMDAVRVHDISKLADISNIQTYTINGAKIVFLLSRPQDRVAKAAMHWCLTCNRTLSDANSFCSISCKLAAVPRNPSVSLALLFPEEDDHLHHDKSVPAATSPTTARHRTCCLENEQLVVKSMAAERLTDEQRLSKAGRKAHLPLKKRKHHHHSHHFESDDDVDDFGEAPSSPISVLLPHSPQHSANSLSCVSFGGDVAPQTPQKNCESSSPRAKQRRKGLPQRSPLA